MPVYTLPDLDLMPIGTQYDFSIGSDGRQGGNTPVSTINTFKPADLIMLPGLSGTTITGKVQGSCLRLVCVILDGTVGWQPQFIAGPWELTGSTEVMVACGEVYNVVKKVEQSVDTSVVPVDATSLRLPYNSNGERPFQYKFLIPFTTGALGGFRFFIDTATATDSIQTFQVFDGNTGTLVAAGMQQGATVAITGTTIAGNHYAVIEGVITSGSGILQLQFAQNVADAAPITILANATAFGFYV